MKRYVQSVALLMLLAALISACASTPEQAPETIVTDEPVLEEPLVETPPEEPAEVVQEEEVVEDVAVVSETPLAPPEEVLPVEPVEEEKPEPLAAPVLSIEPGRPTVGESITVSLDQSPYDSITFDFGDGPSQSSEYSYRKFGIKTLIVAVSRQEQTATAVLRINVTGSAQVILETDTVQHNAAWKPLISASLVADGDFDTIAILQFGREIVRIDRADTYLVPVPFEGTRQFTAELYHHRKKVADVGTVTLTGLNAPPSRPSLEGPRFLGANVGEEIRFSVTAEDPNDDVLMFEVKFAPVGSKFDPDSGIFTWTPTAEQKDLYLMSFYAYDVPYNLKSPFAQRGIVVQ